jgi:hypothetical protein
LILRALEYLKGLSLKTTSIDNGELRILFDLESRKIVVL